MATRRRSQFLPDFYSNDDFDASGVRLVGELDNEVGDSEDDKLDIDGDEHSSS